jgi:DNA invertase Pin-like site-specific DNA recombinase
MAIKLLGFTRVSPDTDNNGENQKDRIRMAFGALGYSMKKKIEWFFADEVDRRHVLEDAETLRLIHFVKMSKKTDVLTLFISRLDRIGTAYTYMKQFLDVVSTRHPNIKVLSIAEFGVDLYAASRLISTSHTQRHELSEECSHRKPGKNLVRDECQESRQDAIKNRANEIIAQWKLHEPGDSELPLIEPEVVTSEHDSVLINAWLNKATYAVPHTGENVGFIAEDIWKFQLKNKVGDGKVLIYLRSSWDTNSVRVGNNDFPREQLAHCLACAELEIKKRRPFSAIFEDEANRESNKRPGFIHLIMSVLFSNVDYIIMKSTNRVSSHCPIWHFLKTICDLRGTKILIADSIGVDFMEIVQRDAHRKVRLGEINQECVQGIANLERSQLYNTTVFGVMRLINSHKNGNSRISMN